MYLNPELKEFLPLQSTSAASATDAAIHKKMFLKNHTRKSLEELHLLIKLITEAIKNEAKEQKEDFLEYY